MRYLLLIFLLCGCTTSPIVPDEVHLGFGHHTGGDDFNAAYTGHRAFNYDEDDSQTYSLRFVYKIKPTRILVLDPVKK